MQWSCRVEKSDKFLSLIGYFCCKKGRVPVIIDCLGQEFKDGDTVICGYTLSFSRSIDS